MAGNEPLLIACRQGPTVSVNLQVPAGTKASGLQQLLAAANGVDVSNDVTIKVKTGTGSLSCFKNLGQLLAHDDPTVPGKLCCCTLRSTRSCLALIPSS